jgi:F-type H+-transporting ATPase subunit a
VKPFPDEILRIGTFVVTDVELASLLISVLLVVGLRLGMAFRSSREVLEVVYELLDGAVRHMTTADVRALVPLVLTQWAFIGVANLAGLLPGISSPTRDLSLAAALAAISFLAGHVLAFRALGVRYLKHYLEPNPLLLPFNIIGEASRTVALALRLFGNMLSGTLVGAIFVYLAGLLIPVPLMLLSALTAVVQAYIFGVLTLVFAASSLETAGRSASPSKQE